MSLLDLSGVCTGPGLCDVTPIGNGRNWVNKVGGLPLYIRAIAQAQLRAGRSESEAIRLAVGIVRRWAHGAGHVTPATRARARAALAEWDRKKTESHTHAHLAQEAPMTAVDLAGPTSMAARMMPDRAAVIRLAKKVDGWPAGPRKAAMLKMIAGRARALGMKPDADGDYDQGADVAKRGLAGAKKADMAGSADGVDLAGLNAAARARLASAGKALPGGRFPIANRNHLAKAIRMVGLAKGDHVEVRRFIHKRATALGATDMLPKGWKPDGTLTLRSKLTGRGR